MPEEQSRRILGTQFVKLNTEGEKFVGTLTGKEPIRFGDNETFRYTFTSNGRRFAMNGTNQIDDALAEAEIGDVVEIKYVGTVQTQAHYWVKQFECAVLDEEN